MTWDREVDKVLANRFWDIHQGLLDIEVNLPVPERDVEQSISDVT